MKLATPFITMFCLALFFAAIGPIGQAKTYISDFVMNNSGLLSGLLLGGVALSVMTFAVWILRR